MLFYENAVVDYLKADRAVFVNAGCRINLDEGVPEAPGRHWYCDAIACDFRSKQIFLCEVSFATRLDGLIGRLASWNVNWGPVCGALHRDSVLPHFPVRPWIFIPEKYVVRFVDRITGLPGWNLKPRITVLEMVQPWKYNAWDRLGEHEKPDCVPLEMRD